MYRSKRNVEAFAEAPESVSGEKTKLTKQQKEDFQKQAKLFIQEGKTSSVVNKRSPTKKPEPKITTKTRTSVKKTAKSQRKQAQAEARARTKEWAAQELTGPTGKIMSTRKSVPKSVTTNTSTLKRKQVQPEAIDGASVWAALLSGQEPVVDDERDEERIREEAIEIQRSLPPNQVVLLEQVLLEQYGIDIRQGDESEEEDTEEDEEDIEIQPSPESDNEDTSDDGMEIQPREPKLHEQIGALLMQLAKISTRLVESIVLSSVVAYHVFRDCLKPEASREQILKAVMMAAFVIFLFLIGLKLGGVYLFFGVFLGSAVIHDLVETGSAPKSSTEPAGACSTYASKKKSA